MNYIATIVVIFATSAIAALALNIIVGYAGQLAVTQGALMAIGAYTTGTLSAHLQLNTMIGIFVGLIAGGLVGLLFALASVRLTDYDYVLVSLILQMMSIELIRRGSALTGGSGGLSGIKRPELFGLALDTPVLFAILALAFAAIVTIIMIRMGRSPYALMLRGFRDSESSVAALGKNTTSIRLSVGLVAGLGAGLAGALQSSFLTFITPSGFTEFLSILIVIYLLVGGMGNMWGALVGVAILIAIPEILRSLDIMATAYQAPAERIIYGLVVLAFVAFRPAGIIAERPILRFGESLALRRSRGSVTQGANS